MSVLVTGGAGYIGSHTARLLVESGETIIVLDSLESGHREAVGDAVLIEGNVADEALLRRLFRQYAIDAVIHFAAYKAAADSLQQPARYFANNVGGSLVLLRAVQEAAIRTFVFSSTCAVYGAPQVLPVDEAHPLQPLTPYAESKLMVERLLHWMDVGHDVRSVSLRYFNAAGAALDATIGEDTATPTNLIPRVMQVAVGQSPAVSVFGTDFPTPDGTAIRDYIHVVDLAEAHRRALCYLQAGGRSTTINLGTGTGASVRQVIDAVRRVSGVDFPVEYQERRAGDSAAIWADNRKVWRLLEWEPRYNLHDIIRSAWRWHSTHPDGYRTIGRPVPKGDTIGAGGSVQSLARDMTAHGEPLPSPGQGQAAGRAAMNGRDGRGSR